MRVPWRQINPFKYNATDIYSLLLDFGMATTAIGLRLHSNTRRAQNFKVDVQTDCFVSLRIDEEPLALRDVA